MHPARADFRDGIRQKQQVISAIMRSVAAWGLAFVFPTSVMQLDGPVAKQLAGGKS